MKAVALHDIGDIHLDEVPEPQVPASTDAVIRITASAICGTDLHVVRGTVSDMRKGTILGHKVVGISDIFPADYSGVKLAEVCSGDTVAALGAGLVGQFAIASTKLLGASRVFAIDHLDDRMDMARRRRPEVINFDREDPVDTLCRQTNAIGVDRAIAEADPLSESRSKKPGDL